MANKETLAQMAEKLSSSTSADFRVEVRVWGFGDDAAHYRPRLFRLMFANLVYDPPYFIAS